tara:strand:+ start:2006 stop:2653 length:648 start_codon:yes stop_codon:yes gene_type:complete
MEKTTIKFCGFTNTNDIKYALDCDIDYIGLIFTEKSPRCISINQAEKLCQLCDGKKNIVGVFMDQPKKFVENMIDNLNLNFLQFHGNESYDYCNSFNHKYTKTLHINNPDYEFNIINKYHDAHAFLLDTNIGDIKGGTGKTFDWSLIDKYKNNKYKVTKPLMIAGGLNPDNVMSLIDQYKPYGVDVNSGIESKVGKKDYLLMKKFIENVRMSDKD